MHFPKRIRLPHAAYRHPAALFHVVVRAFPGIAPFATAAIARPVWDQLLQDRDEGGVEVVAACLMPDHLHLLAQPREADLIRWIGAYKSKSTHAAWKAGHQGRLWQPSFWDRRLREGEGTAALRYVLQNPVEAGLVDEWQEWPWVATWWLE